MIPVIPLPLGALLFGASVRSSFSGSLIKYSIQSVVLSIQSVILSIQSVILSMRTLHANLLVMLVVKVPILRNQKRDVHTSSLVRYKFKKKNRFVQVNMESTSAVYADILCVDFASKTRVAKPGMTFACFCLQTYSEVVVRRDVLITRVSMRKEDAVSRSF